MNSSYKPLSAPRRILLIGVGTVTLGLGVLGMFLPGVPTTVFLLITIACYTRSSERLYVWMVTRPWLQGPLQTTFAFKEKGTLPLRIKLVALTAAWSSFALTLFTSLSPFAQLFTLILALSCTIAMIVIKTERL